MEEDDHPPTTLDEWETIVILYHAMPLASHITMFKKAATCWWMLELLQQEFNIV
jgi:hypothetical protein